MVVWEVCLIDHTDRLNYLVSSLTPMDKCKFAYSDKAFIHNFIIPLEPPLNINLFQDRIYQFLKYRNSVLLVGDAR